MARRRRAEKRVLMAEPRHHHAVLAKFINCMMYDGKKSKAEAIVYKALASLSERVGISPIEGFEKIVDNIRPLVEVRSRRVGGATYQVPMEVRAERSIALSLRWIIKAARSRGGKDMSEKLLGEFLDAYNERGSAIKKREDTHKMAEANKAFMHYKW